MDELDQLRGRVEMLEMMLLHLVGREHSLDEGEALIASKIALARKINRNSDYIEALKQFQQLWRAGREPSSGD